MKNERDESEKVSKDMVCTGEGYPGDGEAIEQGIELCPPADNHREISEKVSVTMSATYPAFEQTLKKLPKLTYEPAAKKLVLEAVDGEEDSAACLAKAFGLTKKDAAILLAGMTVTSVVDTQSPGCEQTANAVLGLIADSNPQDAIEAMLVSLITSATIQTSKAFAAAGKQNSSYFSQPKADPLALPIRMMNATAKLVDALSRYQRRGEQKVVVQHMQIG